MPKNIFKKQRIFTGGGTNGINTATQTALNLKANIASPTLTGTPAAPTATANTNTTQIATTAFVTTADNLKENVVSGVVASGTDTYTATYTPTPTSYTDGFKVLVRFTNANTTACTINFNSLGAKSIVKNISTALVAGDIAAGDTLFLEYDGTNFIIVGSNLKNFYTTWSPTFAGFSANPTVLAARYCVIDKMCTCYFNATAGTSNATTTTITLPFTAANTTVQYGYAGVTVDNGGAAASGQVRTRVNSNICDVFRTTLTAWTASGSKNFAFSLTYEIA